MLIEFRIPMPMTVAEYQRAQIFMISKFSKNETHGNEGIQVLINERYEELRGDRMEQGQFTHKIIHLSSRIPCWLTYVIPSSALQVHEKSWNAYPFTRGTYSIPILGQKFLVEVSTVYLNDSGTTENALNLRYVA